MNKSVVLASLPLFVLMNLANANEVQIQVNKPMEVTYQIAHQNPGGNVILSEEKTLLVNSMTTIPVNLDGYKWGGIVPVVIDGLVLPSSHNQFNQRNQCSMTTDKNYSSGELGFTVEKHKATCTAHGGIFG